MLADPDHLRHLRKRFIAGTYEGLPTLRPGLSCLILLVADTLEEDGAALVSDVAPGTLVLQEAVDRDILVTLRRQLPRLVGEWSVILLTRGGPAHRPVDVLHKVPLLVAVHLDALPLVRHEARLVAHECGPVPLVHEGGGLRLEARGQVAGGLVDLLHGVAAVLVLVLAQRPVRLIGGQPVAALAALDLVHARPGVVRVRRKGPEASYE